MQFSNDNVNWTDLEAFSTAKSYTLPSGDGTKTVYARVMDNAGLTSEIASASIELSTAVEGTVVTIATIPAGTAATADFTPQLFGLTGVTITAKSDLKDVIVNVEQETLEELLSEKEITVLPPGIVYQFYWDINTNIESSSITSVRLDFKIERAWVTQNQVDEQTIKMYRFNSGWQQLPTVYARADEKYFYYEATSPGFSIFTAIGERKIIVPVPPVPPPSVKPIEPMLPSEFFSILAMSGALAGFSIIYSLTRPSRYYTMLKRLEKAVAAPKRRRVGKPLTRAPATRRVSMVDLIALR